ncbi:MAG: DUF882 domain-containing protein [Polyangiaceae bacterium]|nr:DUF882 domain-containing protein [Polyangiaceae bacterium]
MVRGRHNRITRTVGLALAAFFALASPLASGDALAAAPDATVKAQPAKVDKAPTTKATKRGTTAKKAKAAKSAAKPRKPTKSPQTATASTTQAGGAGVVVAKHAPSKASAATTTASAKKGSSSAPAKGKPATKKAPKTAAAKAAPTRAVKASKKASTRAPGAKRKTGKKSDADAERPPCFAPAVAIDRNGLENETFSLVDCKGKPLASAREKLSILARPWGTPRPVIEPPKKTKKATKRQAGKDKPSATVADTGEIAPNVRLLDPGLLTRIDAIARHFPGKHVSLVSGYRPRSRGSLHQTARAIDMRVAGVSNEEVVAFCKTITDTGCGYYPNSSFVHVDVRAPGTGTVTWIDASGPGEAPRYVSAWPPPPEPKAPDADVHDDATPEGIEDEVMRDAARPAATASEPTPAPAPAGESRPEDAKEADPKDPVPAAPTNPAPDKPAPKETAAAPPANRPAHPPAPHAD